MTANSLPIIVVVLSTILSAFGALYLKKASSTFSLKLKFLMNKYFILGLFFYGIATVIYLITLRFGEVSILFPAGSAVYIWVSLLSQKYLGEQMNVFKWFGITAIILGVVLLSFG